MKKLISFFIVIAIIGITGCASLDSEYGLFKDKDKEVGKYISSFYDGGHSTTRFEYFFIRDKVFHVWRGQFTYPLYDSTIKRHLVYVIYDPKTRLVAYSNAPAMPTEETLRQAAQRAMRTSNNSNSAASVNMQAAANDMPWTYAPEDKRMRAQIMGNGLKWDMELKKANEQLPTRYGRAQYWSLAVLVVGADSLLDELVAASVKGDETKAAYALVHLNNWVTDPEQLKLRKITESAMRHVEWSGPNIQEVQLKGLMFYREPQNFVKLGI